MGDKAGRVRLKYDDDWFAYSIDFSMNSSCETYFGLSFEWATMIVPLVIFFVGILFDRLNKHCSKKKENKLYRQTIYEWIDLLKNPITAQINTLEKLSNDIKNSETLQPVSFSIGYSMANKLGDVSADKIIALFVLNHRRKNEQNGKKAYCLVSQFDFLTRIEDDIVKTYYDYYNCCEKLCEQWNSKWKDLLRHRENLHGGDTQEFTIYSTIFWAFQRLDCSNMTYKKIIDDFVNPLYNELKSVKSQNPAARNGDDIFSDLKELRVIDANLKEITDAFQNKFADTALKINGSYKVLEEAKDYFRDRECKGLSRLCR